MIYLISLCLMSSLTSCGLMPQALGELEHVIDDTAISVKISQEALRKDQDLNVLIESKNH